MKHAELAAMELERFGLCVQGALVTMLGTVSEMLQVMDEMGVTAFAEATSKYSGDLLSSIVALRRGEKVDGMGFVSCCILRQALA